MRAKNIEIEFEGRNRIDFCLLGGGARQALRLPEERIALELLGGGLRKE